MSLGVFVCPSKEPGQQRVKIWAFGIDEVLKDPVGREQFLKFLESEFSSENLRYTHTHICKNTEAETFDQRDSMLPLLVIVCNA